LSEVPTPGGLWVVSAPSGGGKTSLTRALIPKLLERDHPTAISVSYTTRAPRPGEKEGVHYHFIDKPAFIEMVEHGAFLEHAEVFGRHYGTGRAKTLELLDAGTDVILDIDWQGGRQVRASYPECGSIFILPPSLAELERRLRGRGQDSDDVIAGRMLAAHSEMEHYAEYEYLIVNRDFEVATEEMAAILVARRLQLAAQRRRHAGLIDELLEQGTRGRL